MLTIRMQRTGRTGHAMFRVVVQDSRQTPTSGKVVALLGSYDPHAKTTSLTKDKAEFYLKHGAQPSTRVASLFRQQGISLPKWVEVAEQQSAKTKHPEKLRKNRPADTAPTSELVEEVTDAVPEAAIAEAEDATSEPTEQTASVDVPAENSEVTDALPEKTQESDEPSAPVS